MEEHDVDQYERIQKLNEDYAKALANYAEMFERNIQLLEKLKKDIRHMKIQIDYLKHENEEYRRKLSRITDTWYGRAAVRLYQFLMRLGRKLNSVIRRGG